MLDLLVLKNAVECTSQRLKWASGARVMIIFGLKKRLFRDFWARLVWEAQGTSLEAFLEEPRGGSRPLPDTDYFGTQLEPL